MASRRFVDRGFWKCRELNGLDTATRLLAIYLFSDEADDFGRVKDDPYRLRNGCFPDDNFTDEHIVMMVDRLALAEFVKRYFARDERPLLWLPTFQQYQPRKYWATSYLDRHPDDDFVVVDSKTVDGKRIKQERPLAPLGHVNVNCAVSPQLATSCHNSPQVASPIPIPIPTPIPMSAQHEAADADVAVQSPSKKARRKVSRRVGNGVPLNDQLDTANGIKAPDGVVAEDWWRLLRLTASWPLAGKTGGLKKLGAILKANGPKDAEAYIAKADRCWKAGGVDVGPWAIFATGFPPSDGDRDGGGDSGQRKNGGGAEAIGDVLAKGITG